MNDNIGKQTTADAVSTTSEAEVVSTPFVVSTTADDTVSPFCVLAPLVVTKIPPVVVAAPLLPLLLVPEAKRERSRGRDKKSLDISQTNGIELCGIC